MRLACAGEPHLTYCTNIHPGETWAAVRANLERHLLRVRTRVAPDAPFGIGLRLSARAAEELAAPAALDELRTFLAAHDLYVFTINGFPYGRFHGTAVKEAVYLPDWRDDARLRYSDRLAELLAALLPDDPRLAGSVSTVPGAFKPHAATQAAVDAIVERLVRHVATLQRLRARTGKTIALALEPEPWCQLETVAETVAFFARMFAPPAVARVAALTGLGRSAAEQALRTHLGVCLDACHLAVEWEEPAAALAALAAAGIAVAKIQVSAGLEVTLDGTADEARRAALGRFADDVYLHQVVERRDGALTRWVDLPDALAAAGSHAAARTWRVHCHVPLFRAELGPFRSTQPEVRRLLELVARRAPTQHLEVETYTWDVLPAELRSEDVTDAIARELEWTRAVLEPASAAAGAGE